MGKQFDKIHIIHISKKRNFTYEHCLSIHFFRGQNCPSDLKIEGGYVGRGKGSAHKVKGPKAQELAAERLMSNNHEKRRKKQEALGDFYRHFLCLIDSVTIYEDLTESQTLLE